MKERAQAAKILDTNTATEVYMQVDFGLLNAKSEDHKVYMCQFYRGMRIDERYV